MAERKQTPRGSVNPGRLPRSGWLAVARFKSWPLGRETSPAGPDKEFETRAGRDCKSVSRDSLNPETGDGFLRLAAAPHAKAVQPRFAQNETDAGTAKAPKPASGRKKIPQSFWSSPSPRSRRSDPASRGLGASSRVTSLPCGPPAPGFRFAGWQEDLGAIRGEATPRLTWDSANSKTGNVAPIGCG